MLISSAGLKGIYTFQGLSKPPPRPPPASLHPPSLHPRFPCTPCGRAVAEPRPGAPGRPGPQPGKGPPRRGKAISEKGHPGSRRLGCPARVWPAE